MQNNDIATIIQSHIFSWLESHIFTYNNSKSSLPKSIVDMHIQQLQERKIEYSDINKTIYKDYDTRRGNLRAIISEEIADLESVIEFGEPTDDIRKHYKILKNLYDKFINDNDGKTIGLLISLEH